MKKILEAIVVGILFGLLTHIANKYLPDDLKFIFDTKLIWLVPAFLLAFNMPLRRKQSDSIIVSVVTLLVTGLTYYTTDVIKNSGTWYFTDNLAKFIPFAIIAGAAIGILAYLGHSATNQFIRYGSVSFLPALYTGDGINEVIKNLNNFQFTPEIGIKLIGGILFYIVITGRNKFKAKSITSFLVLAAIATLLYLYML